MTNQLYFVLKVCLSNRYVDIKVNKDVTNYHLIKAGVSQGSVLGPFLYLIYTALIPTTDETDIATFADVTAVIATDDDLLIIHSQTTISS